MAFYRNMAEGGTDLLDATISNTGGASGDPFSTITEEGTTNIQFRAASALHGTMGYRLIPDPATTNRIYVGFTFTAGLRLNTSLRFYFRMASLPTTGGSAVIAYWANTTNTSQRCAVRVNPSGTFVITNAAVTTVFTSTASLAANTTYRMEVAVGIGVGTITLRVFLGDSITPITGMSADLVSQSIGGTNGAAMILLGYRTIVSGAGPLDLDEIAIDDTTLDLLGPAGMYEIPFTVTFIGSAVVNIAWTHPSDAAHGVSIARAPGLLSNDNNGRPPHHPLYDPMTLPGAVMVAAGLAGTASPYADRGVPLGSWTYWIVRTT